VTDNEKLIWSSAYATWLALHMAAENFSVDDAVDFAFFAVTESNKIPIPEAERDGSMLWEMQH